MEVRLLWLIWLIIVPILLAALLAATMWPAVRGNRIVWLAADLLMIALGILSIPPRYR
ncbi:MAG TPA: hypothetical protein VNJ12_06810 [Candidatus Dormibacteraeota bacterium]|nr:hypothetical protein [Candidatus Dormibacteraeota bacterium]